MTLYAKLIAGFVVLLIGVGLWMYHNHSERELGAATCIEATTTTKQAATVDVQAIEQTHADQLGKVVAVYEQKLADSNRSNNDLAVRLRGYTLRACAVPGLAADPASVPSTGARAGGDRGAQPPADVSGISDAVQSVIVACQQDADELAGLQAAWKSQNEKKPGG